MGDLYQDDDGPDALLARLDPDEEARAFGLIREHALEAWIEIQMGRDMTPRQISENLAMVQHIQIAPEILERWIWEESTIRQRVTFNPMVQRYLRDHPDEAAEAVPRDIAIIDDAIAYTHRVVTGKDLELEDRDMVAPVDRVKLKLSAVKEMAGALRVKYGTMLGVRVQTETRRSQVMVLADQMDGLSEEELVAKLAQVEGNAARTRKLLGDRTGEVREG